jgi:REP element-mobilizing transposase RayT
MARGNARMTIFTDSRDARRFLDVLGTVASSHQVRCWAYCLMPNHYHLVLQTALPNLSRAMRQVNGVYAQWWNHRHERVGHVTQGRFKAQVVQQERYLLAVCRYVLLNPVRAGLTARPEAWTWSSCAATLGLAPAPGFLETCLLLDAVGGDQRPAQRARLAAMLHQPDALEVGTAIRADHRVIGDPAFVDQFRAEAAQAGRGIPTRDRALARPSLQAILTDASGGPLQSRVQRAAEHRYPVEVIAAAIGIGRGSVRNLLIRAERGARPDPAAGG